MHALILNIAVVWLLVLFLALIVLAARSGSFLNRILALDTASLVVIALLAIIAQLRESMFYLDAALALALLSFVGTLAAVHYKKHGEFSQ